MVVEYSNLKVLSSEEQISLRSVIDKGYNKIVKQVPNVSKLQVNVKVSNKGNAKRYMISVVLRASNKIFSTKSKDSERFGDYDITLAAHKIVNHITNEALKGLRSDTAEWKKHNVKSLFDKFFK